VSALVGRRRDVAEVGKLVSRERLVCVTGAGGVGKTRLAIEVATRAVKRFPDGVWMAELVDVTEPEWIPSVVAAAVPGRRRRTGRESADEVARQIGDQSLLIMLDNCEHLADECAVFVQSLLVECPALHVLATSRERLLDRAEHVWPLGGLSLPARDRVGAPSVNASEAGKLFLQRATEIDPEFRFSNAVAPAIAEICWRLDGMPLAIELAASLLASHTVEEIRAGLDGRFDLLDTATEAKVDPRHRTLGAVLQWSHELLTPAEAVLFRRVSVFPSFTLPAAEEVCALDEAEKAGVLDGLHGLVTKSLVVVETGSTPRRYRQLDIVRHWAARKLTEAGEATALHRRYLLWCLAQGGLVRAVVGDTAEAVSPLGHGSEPFAEAADAEADVRVGESMLHMFTASRQSPNQIPDIDRSQALGDPKELAHLLGLRGQAHYFAGQFVEAHRNFAECVQVGRGCSDGEALRVGLFGLARTALARGDYAEAEAWVEEVGPLAEDAGDLHDISIALGILGNLACGRGDWHRSRQLLDQSVEMARAHGGPLAVGRALCLRAQLTEWEDGQLDHQAESMLEEALSLSRAGGALEFLEARCLLGLGSAAAGEGDLDSADRLFREARKCAEAAGDVQASARADHRLGDLARGAGKTDEALTLVHRGLEVHHRIGEVPAVAAAVEAVAGLAAEGGSAKAAARLFGAVQTLRDTRGYARSKGQRVRHATDVATARRRLTSEAFTSAWAEGASLSVDEAVSFARRGRGRRSRPLVGWESLTPSELDVALRVGDELSNSEVGRRLVMNTRTVAYHLSNVYRKLGIHSRNALKAALAARGVDRPNSPRR
jgi:predicted ATPase/DNA-binding CsgD family transcriptional regulator